MGGAYSTIACVSAFLCGSVLSVATLNYSAQNRRQKALKQSWQGIDQIGSTGEQGLAVYLLEQLERYNMLHDSPDKARVLEAGVQKKKERELAKQMLQAGLSELSLPKAAAWRFRNACLCAAIFGTVGLFVSVSFAIAMAGAGFLLGWASLVWVLKSRITQRSHALERHLSEAIEVMCLGLRSGLSFERSLELYCANFPSQLSAEFARAQQLWNTGLMTRETALRNLAASYDSLLFDRVIESIVRSLRFGSPLANSLEDLAHEARKAHRARVEEAVMKAPIKMMLPIGLLILPSMLLLVMGPIMLDLITGF